MELDPVETGLLSQKLLIFISSVTRFLPGLCFDEVGGLEIATSCYNLAENMLTHSPNYR